MKLAVCVKEVLDTRVPLQVVPQTGEVVQLGTEPVTLINPSDRAALEVALVLRSRRPDSRVEVFSVCDTRQEGALHFALARGADAAERLVPHAHLTGPPYTALLLASRLADQDFDLVCCGDETLDSSSAMVGPLIAELLKLPQVTGISKVRECSEGKLRVERSLDRGHRELVEMELPGVATFKVEAAEPHYVSWRKLELVRHREIPARRLDLELSKSRLPKWPDSEKKVPPRARVKKNFMPDTHLPPAERLKMIMAGGMAPQPSSPNSPILDGDPDYLAEQLFRFLKHHEFV
jgi:electron transfer flavoprotein beta subunit